MRWYTNFRLEKFSQVSAKQEDSATPHTSVRTTTEVVSSYSPDVASFSDPGGCTPRTPFCGRRLTERLRQRLLRDRRAAFYAKVEKCVLTRTDDLWKNNLVCVKDVTVIYINLFIIVIIVSEKNWEVYFRTAPRMCTFCCIMT